MRKHRRELPSQERLHELFYCVNGILIRKKRAGNHGHIGDKPGNMDVYGYYYMKVDGVMYKNHRLIYQWYYGETPDVLNHIDTNRANNVIWNLEPSSPSHNSQHNKKAIARGGVLRITDKDGKRVSTELGLSNDRARCKKRSKR